MERRRFLTGAGLAGAGLAAAGTASLATPAIASGTRRLRMVTTWPKNFPGLGMSAERMADRIKALTNGEIEVKVFAATELVPALEAFDTVSRGGADMYNGAEYYWQGKSVAFNFFTAVPFGMTANEINAWIYFGGGQALWDELSARFNINAYMSANSGVQMGGWFRKEINTLEDFKGLKIRMPGLGGEVMRRLGAAAITLAGNDIYQSLQAGTIDATEWVGPWNDIAFGFDQVAPYYYWAGFHEPGSALATGFNLDVWNSLTPFQQQAIETACMAENNYTLAEFNHFNATSLQQLIAKGEVQLKRFSTDIMAGLKEQSTIVLEEAVSGGDELTKRVYESYKTSIDASRGWTRIAEQAFTEARG